MTQLLARPRQAVMALGLFYLLLATPVARHGLEASMSAHIELDAIA